MCSNDKVGETTTVNAIVYDVGHVAVLMPDERPIKHVVLEAPAERGMVGDLTWRYYIPESYAATLANENSKLRELANIGEYAANECSRLAGQNAKLREQLDYVTPIAWYAASERERDRMRELGVEV